MDILFIDDNNMDRELMSGQLGGLNIGSGYSSLEVSVHGSPLEAKSDVIRRGFDLIICDYKLNSPEFTSGDFLRFCRFSDMSQNKDTPFLVVSASRDPQRDRELNSIRDTYFILKTGNYKKMLLNFIEDHGR